MRYPIGDINENLWVQILNQLPNETAIVPFFRGEPTLHPKFSELLQTLDRFTTVQLATNGDHLTHTNKRAILENVTYLSLSIHKFTLPVESTWLPFLHEAKDYGVTTQISIVNSALPQKWRGHFTREWLKHADKIRIYEEHSQNGFGNIKNKTVSAPCNKPFEDMIVYWNGKVGLCNHDWNNPVALGDLNTQTISEVYNSAAYKAVRSLHAMGMRKQVETCKDCSFQSKKISGEIICR